MKTIVFGLLLASASVATPLDWLQGNYQGHHDGSTLLEHWEVGPDGEAVGTTVWSSAGGVELQELFHIRPRGKNRYRLDLWIWSADFRKHLTMNGRLLESSRTLKFEVPPGQHPESLTYEKDARGQLQVTLAKKALTRFRLRPVQPQDMVPPHSLVGDYEAHTFFANHQFLDHLRFQPAQDGLKGSLEVTGKFVVPLENLQCQGLQAEGARLNFECLIPEGETPYRVSYRLKFTPDGSQAVGHLEKTDTRERLGSVVLRRKAGPPKGAP